MIFNCHSLLKLTSDRILQTLSKFSPWDSVLCEKHLPLQKLLLVKYLTRLHYIYFNVFLQSHCWFFFFF